MTEPTTQEPITSDIECGEPRTGQIASGEILFFSFNNTVERAVAFSTCFSSVDTTLYLYDDANNAIQSQSTNRCDGDDCHDSSVFANCPTLTETFTMSALPVGHYELRLRPFGSGGSYDLRVICDATAGIPGIPLELRTTQEPITSDIDCDEPQTGQIASGQTMFFSFNNGIERDISFSTCFSEIDTQLSLYDPHNNAIQSQSTNRCDGDDCHDSSVFANCPSLTETFTMSALDIGHYVL